jgi:hypothetical protein
MPVRVDFPTRLTVDVPALSERRDDIAEAVAAAVGRALSAAGTEVLEPRGGYAGVRLNEPEFSWSGDGLGTVTATVRGDVEDAVRSALGSAANDAGLPRQAGQGASTPLMKPAAVSVDDDRYDPFFALYDLPVYHAAGEEAKVAVKRRPAKDHPGFAAPIFEWYPMDEFEALDAYERAARGANQPPPHGYMGAIYADRRRGMTIDVVEYADGKGRHVFRASQLRLVDLIDDAVGPDMTLSPVNQLPTVSRYLIDFIGTRGAPEFERRIRALFEPKIRFFMAARKGATVSEQEFADALKSRLDAYVGKAKTQEGVDDSTVFMRLRVHVVSFLLILQPHSSTGQPNEKMEAVRLLPLVRPAEPGGRGGKGMGGTGRGRGPGGEGLGAEGDAADPGDAPGEAGAGPGGEDARRGGAEGGIAGGRPSRGAPAFVDLGASSATGSLFPPTAGETVKLECRAYLGEPSMDQLGADGKRMQQLVDVIAWRLQIEKCNFAGGFLLNAAAALGGRAGQVEQWDVKDQGQMHTAPAGGGNVGNVTFIPTAGPQIRFMRHLAATVPVMTELQRTIDRVYTARGDLITGIWQGNPLSWLNRWKHEYVVEAMERHVGLLFVMTCNVIYRQLLNTSRKNIDDRDNPAFIKQFNEVVMPQLEDLGDLLRARDLLKNAELVAYTLRQAPAGMRLSYEDVDIAEAEPAAQSAAAAPQTWSEAIERVLGAIAPFAAGTETAATYQLIRQANGSYRIRDRHRREWELQGLEQWITLSRGGLEEVEPLVKQFTDVPEILERYRGLSTDDAIYETHRILEEMREKNQEQSEKARHRAWTGFRASAIIENLRGATVPKTNYALQGIHKQAHDMIAEFFHGDPFYGLAIEAVFAAELGRKELAAALEMSFIALLSVVCPPAAAGVGLSVAIHGYVEAEEKRDIYKSLIDPEQVISAAEVEAALFSARLGLALAIIPVGAEAGAEIKAMGGLVERAGIDVAEEAAVIGRRAAAEAGEEAAELGGRAAIRTMSRAAVHLERVLQQGIVERFAFELAQNWLMDKVMSAALDPLMEALQEEWGATGPIGGLDRALERLVQQMAVDGVTLVDVPGGGP